MEISCDIIRDLLPLYAEDMVSQASREMVDDHLCKCDACMKELAALKKTEKLPVEAETDGLKKLGKAIQRRRLLTAAAAVMTLLTMAVTGFIFLMTPCYLTAEEAVEGVELREDGGLAIDYAEGIVGHAGWTDPKNGQDMHLCHTTRFDWLLAKRRQKREEGMTQEELEAYIMQKYALKEMTQEAWDRFHNVDITYGTWETNDGKHIPYDPDTCLEGEGEWVCKGSEQTIWYANFHNGKPETLLWGDKSAMLAPSYMMASYSYCILFFGMLALAAVSAVLARRGKEKARGIFARLAILCGSIAFATLLVTGGSLIIVDIMYKWPGYIAAESAFAAATALVWYQMHTLKREDGTM